MSCHHLNSTVMKTCLLQMPADTQITRSRKTHVIRNQIVEKTETPEQKYLYLILDWQTGKKCFISNCNSRWWTGRRRMARINSNRNCSYWTLATKDGIISLSIHIFRLRYGFLVGTNIRIEKPYYISSLTRRYLDPDTSVGSIIYLYPKRGLERVHTIQPYTLTWLVILTEWYRFQFGAHHIFILVEI